ncbi:MAG: tetratricopeptide repeat protein [Candidatus Methanoplasma sp.]|jgi:tetratricopeptide (TPR) repeat protein|nr:tetratricopeptide repeat protein [Candidatus Methanoplasma sp.]
MKDPEYEAVSKAKRQAESGNPEGAVRTLESYLETDPHNTKARMQLARTHIYDRKDLQTGNLQLEIVLDIEPENTDAMKAMVTVLAKHKKNNKKTVAIYERLLIASPDADLYNAYAIFQRIQMTDFKRSAEYYEKAISLNPREPIYRRNYAVLLLNDLKDYERARNELETLLKLDPGDVSAKKNYDLLMKKKFGPDGKLKKKALFRR